MKKLFSILMLLGLLALMVAPASADSFNVTNVINSGISLISHPTNNVGIMTGAGISVANNEWADFYFSGYSTTNTNATVTVTLVKSYDTAPPGLRFDSTGTNVNGLTWFTSVTNPLIQITIPIVGAGPQYWGTNLDRWIVGGANWLGIYQITNNNNSTQSQLTNCVMGLNKKIIPIRYP